MKHKINSLRLVDKNNLTAVENFQIQYGVERKI